MVELLQQHENNNVHWLQALPLPIAAKISILNVPEFPDPSLKTSPCTKSSPVSCENRSFFLLLRNVTIFIKSHVLKVMYFWSAFLTVSATILFFWIQSMVVQSQNYL